jgi:hypothetical protein
MFFDTNTQFLELLVVFEGHDQQQTTWPFQNGVKKHVLSNLIFWSSLLDLKFFLIGQAWFFQPDMR